MRFLLGVYAALDVLVSVTLWRHAQSPRHLILALVLILCALTLLLAAKSPARLKGPLQAALVVNLGTLGSGLYLQFSVLGFVDAVPGIVVVTLMVAGVFLIGQLRGWPIRLW